jgi:predicted DNA-binding transcriptional regulator YafY
MVYDSWKGVVEREVLPLGVVLKAGTWYAVARVDGQARCYRVASILAFEPGPPADAPPEPFDLAAYWAEFAEGYEARMLEGRARVRALPEALWLLARTNAPMARAVEAAGPPDAEGWRDVVIPIESIPQATAMLLRLGPRAEALEPPELRDALRGAVRNMQAIYGES